MNSNDQLTPQEVEDYGADFLKVVAKQSRAATAGQMHQLQAGMAQVQEQLQREQRRQMTKQLDERVEGWRQQNDDPNFLRWLAEKDQFSGQSRQQLLNAAWQSGAADRVINIFNGYRQEARRPAQHQSYPSAAGTMPSTAGHSRDWPTTGRPIIRGSQITNFYNDVASGRYEHRQDQKNALERALNEAVREGRVQS
jgi:hypothetical protein